jgi:hypothetical protein
MDTDALAECASWGWDKVEWGVSSLLARVVFQRFQVRGVRPGSEYGFYSTSVFRGVVVTS